MANDVIKYAGIKLSIDGAAEFQKSLTSISSSLKLSQAELSKVTAEFGKNSTGIEALTGKQRHLEERLKLNKQEQSALNDMLKRSTSEYGENSKEVERLKVKLIESEAAEIRIKKALDETTESIENQSWLQLGKEVEEANTKVSNALKLSQAELAKASALYGDNSEKAGLLTAKQKYLTDSIATSMQEYRGLNQLLDAAKQKYGENSQEVLDLKVAILENEAAQKKLESSLKEIEKALKNHSWKELGRDLEDAGKKIKNVGEGITDVGKKMTLGITTPIVGIGTMSAKLAIDFESAFAGVRKTVDATEAEFKMLESGIREMAKELPSSAADIAKVGEAAGQLGIEVPHILEFTRTMIDLGESTNLSADQAATSFARFSNIVGMPQTEFQRLGSTVVALGNNFATTEAEIVSMAMRLAGAGAQVGLSEAQIMSFATALSSVGIEAEMGGSAFSKLMIMMALSAEAGGEALADFANIAGMSTRDFQKAFEDDAAGAINIFFQGLNKLGDEGESVLGFLQEMGIEEVRLRDTVLRTSGAVDTLTRALDVGRNAWDENTALVNEAEQRYATMESRMNMLKNQFAEVGIQLGEVLMPHVEDGIEFVGDLVKSFSELDEETKKSIVTFGATAAAVGPVVVGIGSLTTSAGALVTGFGKVLPVLGGASTAVSAFLAGIGPVGWAVAGVTAAVGLGVVGWNAYQKAQENARLEMIHAGDQLNELSGEITVVTDKQDKIKSLADRYKELSTAVDNGTLSTDELVAAEEELALIKQSLIELSDGFITSHSAEKQSLDELFVAVESLTESEKQRAIMNLQVKISETNVAAIEKEIKKWEEKKENIEKNIQLSSEQSIAFNNLNIAHKNLIDSLHVSAITQDEFNTGLQDIATSLNDLNSEYYFSQDNLHLLDHATEEARKKFYDFNTQLDEADSNLAAANGTLEEYNKSKLLLIEYTEGGVDAVASAGIAEDELAKQRKENSEAYKDIIEEETDALANTEEKQAEIKARRKAADDELTAYLIENANELGLTLEDYEKHLEAQEKAYESYAKIATNAFTAIKEEVSISVDDMIKNLNKNADTVETWSKNLDVLAERGINQGLLKYLRDAGPEASKAVQNIVDSADSLEELNEAFERGAKVAADSMRREFAQLERDMREYGRNIGEGTGIGITETMYVAVEASRIMAMRIAGAFAEHLQIQSPSKLMKEYGEYTSLGLAIGIKEKAPEAEKEALDLAKRTEEAIKVNLDKLNDFGSAVIDALKSSYEEFSQIQKNELEEAYREDLKLVKSFYDDTEQIISDSYNEQKEYVENWLDTKKSAAWKEYETTQNALIKSTEIRKEQLDRQVDNQKETTEKIIEQLRKEYDMRIDALTYDETGEIASLQSRIDAIDAETEAEERALKEKENQKKLFDLQQKIAQAKTDEERLKAIEAFNDEIAKQQRAALLQQRRDEKDSLREQIADVKENYAEQKKLAKDDYDEKVRTAKEIEKIYTEETRKIEEEYKKRSANLEETLKDNRKQNEDHYKEESQRLKDHLKERTDEIDKTLKEQTEKETLAAEARRIIIEGNNKEIIELLESYNPKWLEAGQSFADNLLAGITGKKSDIESVVNEIMRLVSTANNAVISDTYTRNNNVVITDNYISSSNQSSSNPINAVESYVIKKGDTLSALAKKFGTTIAELAKLNNILNPDKIFEGDVLKIPKQLGENLPQGVSEGIRASTPLATSAMLDLSDSLSNAFKSYYEIASPSKKMRTYGRHIGEGLKDGLLDSVNSLTNTAKNISKGISDSLAIDVSAISGNTINVLDNMQRALAQMENSMIKVNNVHMPTTMPTAQPIAESFPSGLISGNNFIIREEADVEKIGREIMRLLDEKVNINSRIGGYASKW